MSGPAECSWCGVDVLPGDGFHAYRAAGERRARFCRLEHVAAWGLRGAHWQAGGASEVAGVDEVAQTCSYCEAPLGESRVLLVRERGDHRVPDGFCGVDHLIAWAKAGGRWAPPA